MREKQKFYLNFIMKLPRFQNWTKNIFVPT
jgi:hypothetical protein